MKMSIKGKKYVITYNHYGGKRTIYTIALFSTKKEAKDNLRRLKRRDLRAMYVNPRIKKVL
jgi:hypothetical protein